MQVLIIFLFPYLFIYSHGRNQLPECTATEETRIDRKFKDKALLGKYKYKSRLKRGRIKTVINVQPLEITWPAVLESYR